MGSALHIGGLLRFDVADLLDVPQDKRAEMFRRMSCLRQRLDGALSRARDEWNIVNLTPPTDLDEQPQPADLAQAN